MSWYRQGGKRALDAAAAMLLLVGLSPLLVIVAVIVRWRMGAPVVFSQQRPGLGEAIFRMYKFRTMTEARDEAGRLRPDRERLTPLGVFLRKTSLDELPELWNVLRGDMSLVGPRPLLVRYLPHYTPRERARFSVRPGITGLAQIRGRNAIGWDQRLAHDVEYVERLSLLLDLGILLATPLRVLSAGGVVAAPDTAMDDLDVERSRAKQ